MKYFLVANDNFNIYNILNLTDSRLIFVKIQCFVFDNQFHLIKFVVLKMFNTLYNTLIIANLDKIDIFKLFY